MAKQQQRLERPDWMDYELQILKVFREKHPTRVVLSNQRVTGMHSMKSRQIDVAVFNARDTMIEYAIECKYLNKLVSLHIVEAFCSKLDDMDIRKGVIVTAKGFSTGTKNYALSKGIDLQTIGYEYLKDYYYIPPRDIPYAFAKTTRYLTAFCKKCGITILYEIGEVYGMSDHEMLNCPKCKANLQEVRSDANHRIIKIFQGTLESKETETIIAKHINSTRNEWADELKAVGGKNDCYVCLHEFADDSHTLVKTQYKGRNVCSGCIMSKRTLLIDYKYL